MSEIRFSFLDHAGTDECGVCFAFFKAAVISALADEIRAAEQDGKDGVAWLRPPKGAKLPPLQAPCTTGVSLMAPMLGATRLCASHAPALAPQTSRLAIGQGPLPPGLTMGRG